MISSEDMQHQLDLQKEYEESTAVEYLMELLGQAQQVSSAAASQVLAGNGSRTLTMTLGYTEGQEVVLNVMSQGYLPGVEESYMTFSLFQTICSAAGKLCGFYKLHQHLPLLAQ